MGEPRVMLAIPSYKEVPAASFHSLMMAVIENSNKQLLKRVAIRTSMYVENARNQLTAAALHYLYHEDITHVWWVDDDMTVPPGALEQLLSHDLPIVSGVYYGRDLEPVVFDVNPHRKWTLADMPETGLVKVGGVGLGCCLMKIRVLQEMEAALDGYPFQGPVGHEKGKSGRWGEDVFFFKELDLQMDWPVYLDTDLKCGHVGFMEINDILCNTVATEDNVFVRR